MKAAAVALINIALIAGACFMAYTDHPFLAFLCLGCIGYSASTGSSKDAA